MDGESRINRQTLTQRQVDHLNRIEAEVSRRIVDKYIRGAHEHGGDLQDMSVIELIDSAIDETIDLAVYLSTLKERLEQGASWKKSDPGR